MCKYRCLAKREELVVFGVTAGRLNVQLIGLRHREKVGVLTIQDHKGNNGGQIPI